MVGRVAIVSSCAFAITLATASARAETDAERAGRLFKEGRGAMNANDPASACPKFFESQRLDPAPGTLLNLAMCEDALGKFASALEDLKRVAEALPAGDDRAQFVRDRIAGLERRVPRVQIDLEPGAPAETSIERDGRPAVELRTLPRPLPIDAGEHVLVVRAPGRIDRRYTIVLGPGEQKIITVAPGEVVAPPAPPPLVPIAAPPSPAPAPKTMPLTTLAKVGVGVSGVGGALIVLGVVAGVMAVGDNATVLADCQGSVCRTQAGADAARQGRLVAAVSTVGFVGGGASLAVGTVLLVVGLRRPPLTVVPSTGGVACVGVF